MSVILYLFHSLFLLFYCPTSVAIKWGAKKDYRLIQDAGVKDLIWGILQLLSHIAAEQEAFSFTPWCGAYQKANTVPTLECQNCLIILLGHKKAFWCPRIKVWIAGGIGSHICKLRRYSREVWVKTLMEVLLSRGWKFSTCLPGSDLILPIPFWSTDFCICPPIHLDSFTSDRMIFCPLKNFHLGNPGASFWKWTYK